MKSSLLFLLGSTCFISACAPYHWSDDRAAVCNELNTKMVFSGGTGITRTANIQNAEEPLVQRSYDKRCLK